MPLLHHALGHDPPDGFPLRPWWEPNPWEPLIQFALRDLCRPGDVVFDLGANVGALTLMMSRLVGPRGLVCAWEASPRILAKTQYNLVREGCSNVALYHRAAWRRTGETVSMSSDDPSLMADRIVSGAGVPVRTIALDDFVAASNLCPSFIKMDIEGAEYDALLGMKRIIEEVRPILVLEVVDSDLRAYQLLRDAGYCTVDLARYRRIQAAGDFRRDTLANMLFIPEERAALNPYWTGPEPELVRVVPASEFARSERGDIELKAPISLPAGRYIMHANFRAQSLDNGAIAGLEVDGATAISYTSNTAYLAGSYSDWVVQLESSESTVRPFLRFITGSDPSLVWNDVTILHLPAFDTWRPPIVE